MVRSVEPNVVSSDVVFVQRLSHSIDDVWLLCKCHLPYAASNYFIALCSTSVFAVGALRVSNNVQSTLLAHVIMSGQAVVVLH